MKKIFISLAFITISSVVLVSFNASKQPAGPKVGDIAPEIALKNPDGKVIKLSSLRGNYVVLDFWASWCGPCRKTNPALVRMYKNFSAKKFDNGASLAIYSVSLDNDKAAWVEAIKTDQLQWQDHVCDFLGWRTPTAAIFGVQIIPTNFILDGEGKIVAKNLQDADLVNFLNSRLKK